MFDVCTIPMNPMEDQNSQLAPHQLYSSSHAGCRAAIASSHGVSHEPSHLRLDLWGDMCLVDKELCCVCCFGLSLRWGGFPEA